MKQEGRESGSGAPTEDALAREAAYQARSSFISMVSHELRTPLSAITGFLSIVLSEQVGTINERQREFLEYAQDSAGQMMLLAQDIILLARTEIGQLELQCAELALPEVMAQVLREAGPAAGKQGVVLESQVPPDLPWLWADAARLQQALLNLIHNALRLTPAGGAVTVRAKCGGEMAEISVVDNGSGVTLAAQPSISGRFFQAEDAALAKHGGFGLGLMVARVIVEQHGGRIWLRSEPGRGSIVSFTIPLVQPQQQPKRVSGEAAR